MEATPNPDDKRVADVEAITEAASRLTPLVAEMDFELTAGALLSVLMNEAMRRGKLPIAESALASALFALQIAKQLLPSVPPSNLH